MKRRAFISLLGGMAAAWPLAAPAQQPERIRQIFVLMGTANDAEAQARAEALHQGLQMLGWTIGRNIQIPAPRNSTARFLRGSLRLVERVGDQYGTDSNQPHYWGPWWRCRR